MAKPILSRNKQKIGQLMQDTFKMRQNFIKSSHPNPKDTLKHWPAIFMYDEVMFQNCWLLVWAYIDGMFWKW